jgi:phage host-nuclease inhibitor protein Gam
VTRLTNKSRKVAAPADRAAAEAWCAKLSGLIRERELLEIAMNEAIDTAKADYAKAAEPLGETIVELSQGLQLWAEANREQLTQGGRTKTITFGTAEIGWRIRPPSVSIRGVEAVIETLRSLGLTRFLRTKTEIDKEALRKEPSVAASVPGVRVGSEGEDFFIRPTVEALPDASGRAA